MSDDWYKPIIKELGAGDISDNNQKLTVKYKAFTDIYTKDGYFFRYKDIETENNKNVNNATWKLEDDGSITIHYIDSHQSFNTVRGQFVKDNVSTNSGEESKVKTPPTEETPPQTIQVNITPDDIKSGKIVKYGMRGDIVGKMQQLLIDFGYTDISNTKKPDNIFGPKTFKQVKNFQRGVGLKADGVVGPLTWAKLNNEWVSDELNYDQNLSEDMENEAIDNGDLVKFDDDKLVWKSIAAKQKYQKLNENKIKKIVYKNLTSIIK
jgi:hypothetical protein